MKSTLAARLACRPWPSPSDAARLVREPLTARLAAHEALRALRGDDRPFALIGAWAGGGAVLGSDPLRVAGPDDDVLARLDDLPPVDVGAAGAPGPRAPAAARSGPPTPRRSPRRHRPVSGRRPRRARVRGRRCPVSGARPAPAPVARGRRPAALPWLAGAGPAPSRLPRAGIAGAVGGGWVGYLGFELRHAVEPGHPPPPRPTPLPDGALAFYDHVLRQDGAGRWWFEALWTPERAAALRQRRAELAERLAAPPPPARPFTTQAGAGRRRRRRTPRRSRRAASGSPPATSSRPTCACGSTGASTGEPLDLFAAAVEALPTDRAAFLAGPWGALASLSPELFLARRGRTVRSAPIKGTRPRDRRAELAASAKDRAENVMIVDLVRNDLGRVCRPGGVRVTALAEARPHAGVWHLVSEVEGELADGVRDADLVRAAFPPGSVTGAPKLAALDVIAELESTGREAYTGAIGLASPVAGLELSVAIRTFEMAGDRIWLGVGGGVVADSEGVAEAREAAAKAAPLLAAIGAAVPDDDTRVGAAAAGRPSRAAPRAPPRPRRGPVRDRPRRGRAAAPSRRAPRAARREPARALRADRSRPTSHSRSRAAAASAGAGPRRLRVDVTPELDVAVQTGPPPAAGVVVLRPVVVPGGLGAHKWRDRRLLEAHEQDDPATMPLLLDADGLVLEASRASVVCAAADGSLHTPPADGRILPGTTRARLAAAERPLTLADLRAAPRLYVASALRGCQAATLAG